jgi:hypothetical protein
MTAIRSPVAARRVVAQRFEAVDGRRRVARALTGIAVDVVHPQARYDLRPRDYEWLMDAVSGPVEAATDAALEAFLDELCEALRHAPGTLAADLERLRERTLLGFE